MDREVSARLLEPGSLVKTPGLRTRRTSIEYGCKRVEEFKTYDKSRKSRPDK